MCSFSLQILSFWMGICSEECMLLASKMIVASSLRSSTRACALALLQGGGVTEATGPVTCTALCSCLDSELNHCLSNISRVALIEKLSFIETCVGHLLPRHTTSGQLFF